MIKMAPGRTAAERAASLREAGYSIEHIAERFGWTIASARSMCSRGKNINAFRQRHAAYLRAAYPSRERKTPA